MTPAEQRALNDIQGYAAAGRLRFTSHARKRMNQRNADADDVVEGIKTSTNCLWQPKEGTWRLDGGADLDGDDFDGICVVLDDDVLVVTLF